MCRTIYYKNSKTNISSKELELYKNKKKQLPLGRQLLYKRFNETNFTL